MSLLIVSIAAFTSIAVGVRYKDEAFYADPLSRLSDLRWRRLRYTARLCIAISTTSCGKTFVVSFNFDVETR